MEGGQEAGTIIIVGHRWAGVWVSAEGCVMFYDAFLAFSGELPALGGSFL